MILNDNSTQQINTLVIQLQNRITNLNNEFNKKVSEINDEISDLDTIKKEIADLVKNQVNVDSSMNTQITENKNNIAANTSAISELNTQIQTNKDNIETNTSDISALKTSVAGKADKSHTHTKSEITDFPTSLKNPNALTVNGKTYDGSEAVDAGVQTVANGGTGATTAKDAFMSLANGLSDDVNPIDTEHIIFKNTGGTHWGLYTLSQFWEYIKGKISNVLGLTKDNYGGKADTAGTADKTVEVVDYGDTSRTVRIGYYGPGVTADKLLYLAGYTELDGSSVKLIKDVSKEELIKWLGIPRIKYADYQTPTRTFTQFEQVPIELSKFSSEVTPNNVLCFMVIYWSKVQLIASADWGDPASSGLKCALIALQAGTGSAIIRCVYMV